MVALVRSGITVARTVLPRSSIPITIALPPVLRPNFAASIATELLDAALTIRVHVARLAADEGFINLDFAAETATSQFILHRQPHAVKHEPRGFLGNAHCTVDLPRTDAVLGVGEKP